MAAAGVLVMVGLAAGAMWVGDTKVGDTKDSSQSSEGLPISVYTATFTDLTGKKIVLGEWQHKLLVVNFWATWCAPCKEEMPLLSKLHQDYASQGLQVIGIAADSSVNVANFAKNTPISYPLFPDEAGAIAFSKRLGNRLGLLPHTVLFAPGGQAVYVKLGPIMESEFRQVIEKNLPNISKNSQK